MGIISWIVFGLIAGILAKWIMPGRDGGGLIAFTGGDHYIIFKMKIKISAYIGIIGIAGAFVGGFIGTQLGLGGVSGFNIGSFFTAICGALLLLFVFRKIKG